MMQRQDAVASLLWGLGADFATSVLTSEVGHRESL